MVATELDTAGPVDPELTTDPAVLESPKF